MIRIKDEWLGRGALLPLLAVVTLTGALASGGCKGNEEPATGPNGGKLPENMTQTEKLNAIKSNPNYSDAEKQQAVKNLEMQQSLSRGTGGSAPPPAGQ
jgi:hypothetical protein